MQELLDRGYGIAITKQGSAYGLTLHNQAGDVLDVYSGNSVDEVVALALNSAPLSADDALVLFVGY